MKIAVLSGGTGTPKLVDGLRQVLSPERLSIVVNTAEDIRVTQGYLSPDVDSVLYTLADLIDRDRWWGIQDDTYHTHHALKSMGYDEGMMIGDRDRATHLLRARLLREGRTLTGATREIARRMGIEYPVLPMSDHPIRTMVDTPDGELHFQEFWVEQGGEPEVTGVRFEGDLRPSPEVLNTLERVDCVVVGPSNPVTSVGPILALDGIRDLLREKPVLAVSPIIGRGAVSGPAGKLMRAMGYEVSPRGVAKCYQDFLDVLLIAESDTLDLPGVGVVNTDIMITGQERSRELAETILEILNK